MADVIFVDFECKTENEDEKDPCDECRQISFCVETCERRHAWIAQKYF